MLYYETDYYKLNENLLLMFGLLPSGNRKFELFQISITYVLMVSLIVVQLLKFLTTEWTLDLFLRVLSTVLPSCVSVIRCHSFCVNLLEVKELLTRVHDSWEFLKQDCDEDIYILHQYAQYGRNFTVAFAIFTVSGLIATTILYLLPCVLDVVMPLNETRPRQLLVMAEYFVDPQEYFFPIFLHTMGAITVGMVLVVATESLFTVFILHSCGMFRIAGYRLEHALDMPLPTPEDLAYTRIVRAVYTHKTAVKMSEVVWSTFGISYFVQVATGALSMSVNLLRFYEALILMDDIEELFGSGMFIIAHLVYMMLDNYRGQYLWDHSSDVFYKAYNAEWYKTSVRGQKLFLFVLQACTRDIGMNCFGVFLLSLEGFSTIISISFSYFMVMYSVRDK